jgi:hypothetical protein
VKVQSEKARENMAKLKYFGTKVSDENYIHEYISRKRKQKDYTKTVTLLRMFLPFYVHGT